MFNVIYHIICAIVFVAVSQLIFFLYFFFLNRWITMERGNTKSFGTKEKSYLKNLSLDVNFGQG